MRDHARMTQDAILQIRIRGDLVAALDDLRRSEPDLPSRSEMVRRLIERAGDAAKAPAKAKR